MTNSMLPSDSPMADPVNTKSRWLNFSGRLAYLIIGLMFLLAGGIGMINIKSIGTNEMPLPSVFLIIIFFLIGFGGIRKSFNLNYLYKVKYMKDGQECELIIEARSMREAGQLFGRIVGKYDILKVRRISG